MAGSTGRLGSEIVRQLREQNRPVRALVRKTSDPEKVASLENLGATIVEGELTDRASLESACRGVKTVIVTVTSVGTRTPGDSILKVDQLGHLHLVEVAAQNDVSHFVYVSYSRSFNTACPLTTAKRTIEQRLITGGMAYTILRPSFFMECWLSPFIGFDYPNHRARIYGTGLNPISWISFVDVASFAVKVLDAPAANNAVLELGGPEPLSPNEVIRIFENTFRRSIQVEYVPVETLQRQKAAADDPLQQSFSALRLDYAKGDPIDMDHTLNGFPVSLTSVDDYAQRQYLKGG